MKLSVYARREGITYKAAWLRFKANKIEGAYLDHSGHAVVPEPQHEHVVNAARVISARRSCGGAGVRTSKHGVLAHLDQQFEARWDIAAGRVRERQPRPRSRAVPDHRQVGRDQLVA